LNKFLNASELSGYVMRKFDEKYAISVQNASFSWKKESDNGEKVPEPILNNISVKIAKNSFVAIVGSVGSGKSSLLSALLGDMEIENGSINM
jgi:ABC-type multidrug transport system fused ATPase/permease subunit